MNDPDTYQRCLLCGEVVASADHAHDHLSDEHEVFARVIDALTIPVGERLKIEEEP